MSDHLVPRRPAALTVTFADAAALLGVSSMTLERMVARGDFPRPFRAGALRKYQRATIDRWIAEAEAKAKAEPKPSSGGWRS